MISASIFECAVVVIPARNEERTISEVVEGSLRSVSRVIVIDDCSEDKTRENAIKAGAIVITPPFRAGYGGALLTGWRTALTTGANMIFTIDGDGAHDPSDIPELGRIHLEQSADLTLGDRFRESGKFPIPDTKRWANLFAASLVNRCLGIGLSDVACGFRVLSAKLVQKLLNEVEVTDFSLAFCCLAAATRSPFQLASGPVSVRYDASRPFLTQTGELLNLISWVIDNTTDNSLIQMLQTLLESVQRAEPFTFSTSDCLICAHPMGQIGYLFQRQAKSFLHLSCGKRMHLDQTYPFTVHP